ncbi:hypothetical protein MRX96_052120 [Rhipicephalus microplus]
MEYEAPRSNGSVDSRSGTQCISTVGDYHRLPRQRGEIFGRRYESIIRLLGRQPDLGDPTVEVAPTSSRRTGTPETAGATHHSRGDGHVTTAAPTRPVFACVTASTRALL